MRASSGLSELGPFFAPDTHDAGGGGGGGTDADAAEADVDEEAGADPSRVHVFSLMARRFLGLLFGCDCLWWKSASKSATICVMSSVMWVLRHTASA
jgi:hypothetical protein